MQNIQHIAHTVSNPKQDDELKKQLDKYLAAGQIERSYSPFRASTPFAKKPDGIQRLCIYYRAINDITVKDVYSVPLIDKIINKFAKCKYFSKIDLQQGFHQIRLHPYSIKKTAFQIKYSSLQFLVMPFGLCNAPATFQRTMNFLLHDVTNTNVFIDDITVYSKTLEDTHNTSKHFFHAYTKNNSTPSDPNAVLPNPKLNFVAILLDATDFVQCPIKCNSYTIGLPLHPPKAYDVSWDSHASTKTSFQATHKMPLL